mgnify:CR=1 FL=1
MISHGKSDGRLQIKGLAAEVILETEEGALHSSFLASISFSFYPSSTSLAVHPCPCLSSSYLGLGLLSFFSITLIAAKTQCFLILCTTSLFEYKLLNNDHYLPLS